MVPYPVRSYLIFRNKKCRIYADCGVSQMPKIYNYMRSQRW
ncbi:olfactory receptor 4F15 [Hungatella hathewayi]|nr:olfactory receptor 4F15 [Hungatella hathewayi]